MIKLIPNEFKGIYNEIEFVNNITKDSFSLLSLDNSFCIFQSMNNILYLIYSKINCSIISLNLIENKKINEIKNAHEENITNFRHYLDINNKRDLILSISSLNNNIKIWNINNYECLINIQNINNNGILKSAYFLCDNNLIYIITSNNNSNYFSSEGIKVFDLNGKLKKEIKDSNDNINFIDIYYDYNLLKIYIISGNNGNIKAYNYNENKIFMQYKDYKDYFDHSSIVMINKEIIKIIESSGNGYIRIWNFYSGELLKKIKVGNSYLYSICLLNNDNILVSCRDKKIKLIDIKNGLIKNEIININQEIITLKKLYDIHYINYIISQGKYDDQIKLWKIKY